MQLAGHDPRHVQQVLDQARLPFGAVMNGDEGAFAPGLIEFAPPQHLGPSKDGIERRPELVRDNREELILQPVRLLGAGPCGVLTLEQFLTRLLEPGHLRQRHRQAFLFLAERTFRRACLRQRIDGLLVHPSHFGHVPLLIVEAPDEQLVGSIREVNRGEQ